MNGQSRSRAFVACGVVTVVAFAVYVWGGYGADWSWTGLSSQVTLWDWLNALALPVTVGLLPLMLRHRRRLGRSHKLTACAALLAFAALVIAGYVVPWGWTGFTGNTLWDWLTLALLPVVLATATLWRREPRHMRLLAVAIAVAAVVVAAGYLVPWAWTGFTGNTVWDWIKLLLLPLLLPLVVMPRLLRAVEDWMGTQPPDAAG